MPDSTLELSAIRESDKPFPTAQSAQTPDGKIFHKYYTGKARYIGWIDLVNIKNTIKKQQIRHIVLYNLDSLGKIANEVGILRICTAYQYGKFITNRLILKGKPIDLFHCKPVYRETIIGGWNFSKEDDELPFCAMDFMHHLLIYTKIDSISAFSAKYKYTVSFAEDGTTVTKKEAV
jgi:adenylosuccinate synthase